MDGNALIRARAPVRIDLAGGWTDVKPYCLDKPGFVVNAAINRFAHVTVRERADSYFVLHSGDTEDGIRFKDIRQMEYNGNLDLLKAAVRCMPRSGFHSGIDLSIRSDAPPGSGVGSSSAASVAALSAITRLMNGNGFVPDPMSIAEKAFGLEAMELGIHGGRQDQYAAALGGINAMAFDGDSVSIVRIHTGRDTLLELEERFILCYTGISRLSGDTVSRVMGSYKAGDKNVVGALDSIATIAVEMHSAIQTGDIDGMGGLMTANWEGQKGLAPGITTREIEDVINIGDKTGISGAKGLGAGGGGCVLLLARPGREGLLRRRLSEAGYSVLHFTFQMEGLQVWSS